MSDLVSVANQAGGLIASKFRQGLDKWRDPRAQLLRKRRRARRGLYVKTGLAALAGAFAFTVGSEPGLETSEVVVGGVSALIGASAVSSGVRTVRLYRTPLPEEAVAPPPPPPLPDPGSAAHKPMRRLADAEASLAELLHQLSTPVGGAPLVPEESVRRIRGTAREAGDAARAAAARLQAVERARDASPASERAALAGDIDRLAARLHDGVDGFGRLVATAGRTVAAHDHDTSAPALTEAADYLDGLAAGLRELSRSPRL
ncbi:hypothetical protein G443_004732 [Actinoalloteichus cyanogriseus DSM 43889]|uniref:DUF3618 family protein n=1 Tax=Actinoalloteichus caeruleus DSM 43889 TaxID=1120930 RepID=A0ABT1JPK7_ACTCY|nr:hypothetical protein [Actinoalloteichus caeruleus DSM 43889]